MARHEFPAPGISVIVPVYNESVRIVSAVPQILAYFSGRGLDFELLVVDDGSEDDTMRRLEEFAARHSQVRVLRHPQNRGKGAAVRTGMLAARGETLLFTDADLSAPIAEADRLLQSLQNGADVAIGSRALRREWIDVHQSAFREVSGILFNRVLRLVTGLDYHDTQCGFKAFRREAAQHIFSLQTIEGFGFDPEVLYIARKQGYSVAEIPVHWAHAEGSKVRILRDGLRSFLDLFRIRWNDWRGRYGAAARR